MAASHHGGEPVSGAVTLHRKAVSSRDTLQHSRQNKAPGG